MRGFLVAAFLLSLSSQPAFAWGGTGHRVVGHIADAHLTPAASAAVKRLLALENKSSLADVSTWADEIRSVEGDHGPMHSVRLELEGDNKFQLNRDCPQKRCIVWQIALEKQALRSKKTTAQAKLFALKYLVHFVGDIHEPLHTSKDTGRWPVLLNGEETTLHMIWDSNVVIHNARGRKAPELARDVDASDRKPVNSSGKPSTWALEGRNIARDKIFTPQMMRAKAAKRVSLDDSYLEANWPIAQRRLKEAGHRLAWTLNEIFK